MGAEGIAQFMPGTAKLRGLKNSFDHREALPPPLTIWLSSPKNSAISALRPPLTILARMAPAPGWQNRRTLPAETEDYVLAITGHPAAEWRIAQDNTRYSGAWRQRQLCGNLRQAGAQGNASAIARNPTQSSQTLGRGHRRRLLGSAARWRAFARVKSRYAALLNDELPMVVRTRNLSRGRKLLVAS